MSTPSEAWAAIEQFSLRFANDLRHEYAAKWREYIDTLPEEVKKTQRFHIMEVGLDLKLEEIPYAIEHDERAAAAIAGFFGR